ncbi:MAG: hypothetical protein KGV59_07375 [Tenacibaculum sp.]|nr:hypothetical protein [Tenacibaculum sp.]
MSNIDAVKILFELNPEEVSKQASSIENSLKSVDLSSKKAQEDLKKYIQGLQKANNTAGKGAVRAAGQYNVLNNSINQITRELPAFTYNAQTGFMAISNNIPMLADAIANLRRQNAELVASGKKGVPIWKQLISSAFSWQTALSLGITLMTIYGKELGILVKGWFSGAEATSKLKLEQEALNKAYENSGYKKAVKQVISLNTNIKLAKEGLIDKNKVVKQYNDVLGKTAGIAKNLDDIEKGVVKNSGAYIKMMFNKAVATAALEEATQKQIEAEKRRRNVESNDYSFASTLDKLYNQGKGSSFFEKEAKDNAKKAGDVIAKEGDNLVNIYKEFTEKYQEQAKKLGIDIFDDGKVKSTVNEYKKLLKSLQDLDKEYSNQTFDKNQQELNALKNKFDKVRKLVQDFNKNPKNKAKISLTGLNDLEQKATATLKYRQDTRALGKQLDEQKNLFAFYETMKTKVSKQEADKRYNTLLKGFKSYGELLKHEHDKLQDKLSNKKPNEISGAEKERLKMLADMVSKFNKNQNKDAEKDFIDAYNSVKTHKEALLKIEDDFSTRKIEIEKITNAEIRKEKLTALEQDKAIAIDKANEEAYNKQAIFYKLSDDLTGITKRELKVRIKSLEEYLRVSKGKLTKAQENEVKLAIKNAKSLQGATDERLKVNVLLQRKEQLLKRIKNLETKGNSNVSKEKEELEKLNQEIENTKAEKWDKIAYKSAQIGSIFKGLAGSVAEFDEGLADTLDTMGDLANVGSDVAGAISSFAKKDIIGGVVGIASAIGGLLKMSAKVRESERKARKEIKEWHDKIFQSGLNYNSVLRERITEEIKLNDLYQSRVTNIKEEIEANKKKTASIVRDQQSVFKRLLNSSTIVGKHTYKSGGFLGMWKKTKVKDVKKTISELLGAGRYVDSKFRGFFRSGKTFISSEIELTDDVFDKLEKINAQKPLTGDAKSAFEQLKKLRDEYGSIEKAQRELEIQLKNTVTGTTAKALGDSIREGILSGKKSFADFADDIEKFLTDSITAGMSAKVIEPQMQKLQDELYTYLGDGVLTSDEKQQFQDMYMKIVNEAKAYSELINQTGIKDKKTLTANSLKGAYKTASQESINLLAGQTGGFRITQLQTNKVLQGGFAQQLRAISKQVEIQQKIERNTRKTAENTEELKPIRKGIDRLAKNVKSTENTAKANGF